MKLSELSNICTLTAEYRMLLGAMERIANAMAAKVLCRSGLLRRVIRLAVAHDGVDDVAELPGDRCDGDAVGLALAT